MSNITLTLLSHAPLNHMNVLDVGGNKSYINHGLLRHDLETTLVPQITDTLKNLSSSSKDMLQLAVSGFILPLLKKYAPETLNELQSFVQTKNVALLAVPYYGTSLHILSDNALQEQLNLETDALNKFFKKRANGFFSADGLVPKNCSYDQIFVGKKVTGEVALSTLAENVIATPTIAMGNEVTPKTEFSEMEQHLLTEYQALTPHVLATEDSDLLTEWHLLGQHEMFTKADALTHLHESYDHYATYMNVLNDIAHKIKTVELGKQGLFATQPDIVASPASLLQEFR